MTTPAKPPARYGAMEGARAGGFATVKLHHTAGHDRAAMLGAFVSIVCAMAQAEAEVKKSAQAAGIEFAKAAKPAAYLGRKLSFSAARVDDVLAAHAAGRGVSDIAREAGLSRQAVYRTIEDPAAAHAAVTAWA